MFRLSVDPALPAAPIDDELGRGLLAADTRGVNGRLLGPVREVSPSLGRRSRGRRSR